MWFVESGTREKVISGKWYWGLWKVVLGRRAEPPAVVACPSLVKGTLLPSYPQGGVFSTGLMREMHSGPKRYWGGCD